jgi:hypothetical protein
MKRLFGFPYNLRSDELSTVNENDIADNIDESCLNSCLVFVDGIYSPSLSKTSSISYEIMEQFLQSWSYNIHEYYASIPDKDALNRNSYGSDALVGLNMVMIVQILSKFSNYTNAI